MMYQNKFIVAVKSKDGKILRENGEVVYIPFSEEYSLLLKNLNSRKAAVSIEIDGEDVLGGRQLIINANQTINLERFVENLNEGHKFKFIKKIKEIQEHRGDRIDDGFIRVTFQYEKQLPEFDYFFNTTNPYSKTNPYSITSVIGGKWSDYTVNCSSSNDIYSQKESLSNNINSTFNSFPLGDEGITVKGSLSNQVFKPGYIGKLENEKHTLIIKLKGFTPNGNKVDKPITVKTKLVCSSCGKTSDSSNKFCGRCGTALL